VDRQVVHRHGHLRLALRDVRGHQRHDPVGVRERQSLEQATVHHTENGGAQTDPEAERQNGHDRQRRILDQHPHA
jgi:hypothetical protein